MSVSKALRGCCRLLAVALLVGACALAAPGAEKASAAAVHVSMAEQPQDGCAPCIASLTPPQNGSVNADASGKVTLQFTAQLTNNFVQFVLTIDNTTIDSSKIQVTSNDPLNPAGEYTGVLAAGPHLASVEVDDTNGAASTFADWSFTVVASAQPTATPTKAAGSSSGGNGNNNGGSGGGSSGLLAPRTLSIILFSIAGLGVLVMAFIAGMWFNGRRALRNEP